MFMLCDCEILTTINCKCKVVVWLVCFALLFGLVEIPIIPPSNKVFIRMDYGKQTHSKQKQMHGSLGNS